VGTSRPLRPLQSASIVELSAREVNEEVAQENRAGRLFPYTLVGTSRPVLVGESTSIVELTKE
jgi:hypothetical protein